MKRFSAFMGISLTGLVCCAASLCGGSGVVSAREEPSLEPWNIPSLFFISKSQNRNQVHYGIRLRQDCTPIGSQPVFAYWRMFEEGEHEIAPLLDIEQGAYGLAPQQATLTGGDTPRVRIYLRSFPDRPVVVRLRSVEGACAADVVTDIRGRSAILERIHVVIGALWSVNSITLEGHELGGPNPTFEVVR